MLGEKDCSLHTLDNGLMLMTTWSIITIDFCSDCVKNSIALKYTLGEEHHQERIVYWILSVRHQIKGQEEKGNSQNLVTYLDYVDIPSVQK